MVKTIAQVSLVMAGVVGFAGTLAAREAGMNSRPKHVRNVDGFKPKYQTDTRVTGPAQPYTWPVGDRYRPVSKPYFGRAY